MKSFNVYERGDGNCKAVKNGWSWPAWFFGSIWAFCMQLWLIGVLLLPVELLLNMLSSILERQQSSADSAVAVAVLAFGIRIIFGLYGNAWKRTRLEGAGYVLKKTVNAISKKDAIAQFKSAAV